MSAAKPTVAEPAANARPSQDETKLRLIEAAERLIVENGLGNVSLRQISLAAGQRNTAAAQYHFGGREKLVQAIMEARTAPVNERRLAMLAFVAAGPDGYDFGDLARALVTPLTSSLIEQAGEPTYYARFLARLLSDPSVLEDVVRHPSYTGVRECARLLRRLLPGASGQTIALRIRMAGSAMVIEAAEIERALAETADAPDLAAAAGQVETVVQALTGLFAAPYAAETRS